MYSTTPTEGMNQSLGLVSQLTRLVDPSGLTALTINQLATPSGSGGVIDAFVMNYNARAAFYEKDMFGAWVYDTPGGYQEGTSINARQGKVKIDDIVTGTVYLGLKNPHYKDGVNVTFEAVAIVEYQEMDMSVWTAETKEIMHTAYYDGLIAEGMSHEAANAAANCFLEEMVSNYSLSDFSNMSEAEMEVIGQNIRNKCMTSLGGGEKSEEEKKGSTVGGMAWKAYENGDVDKAITYSEKALEYDPGLSWVHANLGLFSLIKNDELAALDYYLDAIALTKKDILNAEHFFKEYIKDIETAKVRYPELSGYEEILEQLKSELANL
ncbi:MAG: hypothetical protein DCO96_12730 [Fluviicola sp. XM-24bin1]|nr:MAG: hypothetical protein DCO96_12730 [Fluviicola sp. XM-24bin1]